MTRENRLPDDGTLEQFRAFAHELREHQARGGDWETFAAELGGKPPQVLAKVLALVLDDFIQRRRSDGDEVLLKVAKPLWAEVAGILEHHALPIEPDSQVSDLGIYYLRTRA